MSNHFSEIELHSVCVDKCDADALACIADCGEDLTCMRYCFEDQTSCSNGKLHHQKYNESYCIIQYESYCVSYRGDPLRPATVQPIRSFSACKI